MASGLLQGLARRGLRCSAPRLLALRRAQPQQHVRAAWAHAQASSGAPFSSTSKQAWKWHWPLSLAAAVCAGAASAPPNPLLTAHADNSTHQLQQMQAAEGAAERAAHRGSSSSSSPMDGACEPGEEHEQPELGPLVRALVFASHGFTNVLDGLEDLYLHTEARLTALFQTHDEPVLARLLSFTASLVPIVLVSGVAYRLASGVPLSQSLYKMYCLLCRAPTSEEPTRLAYAVTNGVFLFGFFTIAVLLGVVNDEVQKRADDHRCGRNPIKSSGHVLILNWNESTPALLQNIAVASAGQGAGAIAGNLWARKPPVVILASEVDKATMDQAAAEAIRERGLDLTVHTRVGLPFKPSHLQRVAAAQASIVLLLHPTSMSPPDAEAMKAAVAMAFTTLSPLRGSKWRHKHPQRIIVQMPSSVPEDGNVLRSVQSTSANYKTASGRDLQVQVLALPDALLTNRIIAQTAAQPGVLTIWLDILSPSAASSNFKCLPTPPELQQSPYREVRRSIAEGVVCGVVDGSGTVHLNPDEAAVPGPGSVLIHLARSQPAIPSKQQREANQGIFERAHAAAAQRLQRGSSWKYKARNIIVTSWNDVPELIRSISEFAPGGSTVTLVSSSPPRKDWPKALGNTRVTYLTHPHPTSLKALKAAGLKTADCVVVGTGEGRPTDAEADTRVLAALVQVQEAVQELKLPRAPHVVAPIRETGSSSMALRYLDTVAQRQEQQQQMHQASTVILPEFLVFRDVVTSVVVQSASEPAYGDIIAALLFSAEGQEIYLQPPGAFNLPLNEPVSFAEVQELARLRGQTALGFIHTNEVQDDAAASGGSSGGSGGAGVQRHVGAATAYSARLHELSGVAAVHLGLSATDQVVLREGDAIVVLAADYA